MVIALIGGTNTDTLLSTRYGNTGDTKDAISMGEGKKKELIVSTQVPRGSQTP
jgi:hypothetical protein